jgi:hypothetical protein
MSKARGPQGNALIQLAVRSWQSAVICVAAFFNRPQIHFSQTKYPSIDLPLRKEQQEKGKIA